MQTKIKQLTILLGSFLLFFTFTTQAQAKSHYQSTFPIWARGTWYEYLPGDGYTKITFTATKVTQTDKHSVWKDYVTDHDAQNHFDGQKQVYVKGRKFTAQVSPTSRHGRSTVTPSYWRVRRAYVHHRYRAELVSSAGDEWGVSDSYAFRSKVHYQTK